MGEKLDLVNDRENHGLRVELYAKDEDALVVVSETGSDEVFELQTDKASAKDVFEHPFAIKAFREDQHLRWRPSPEPQPTRWDMAFDELNGLFPLDRQEVLGRLAANSLFGSPAGIVELVTRQKRTSENWDYEQAA